MSPVPTLHWVEPGSPPAIQYRSNRDDADLNDQRRADRTLIKGCFRGGKVGYIFKDELPLHRAAYKRELASLQKWQKAFVVYEDQIERDNDRAFYILEDEFYETDLNAWNRRDAMAELIRRFFRLNVWADLSMIKSFTQFPSRDLKEALSHLTGSGRTIWKTWFWIFPRKRPPRWGRRP